MARLPDSTSRTSGGRKQLFGALIAIVLGTSAPARAHRVPTEAASALAIVVAWNVAASPGAVAANQPAVPDTVPSNESSPSTVVEEPRRPVSEASPPPAGQETLMDLPPEAAPRETFIELPPRPEGSRRLRAKLLKMTVGVPPSTGDLGSEADTLNPDVTIGEDVRAFALNENWSFVLKGYLRAPMRVGYGQSDVSDANDRSGPNEFHSMPRMVGLSSSNWAYINIAPNPTGSLRATISNNRVAATLILGTNQFSGAGFAVSAHKGARPRPSCCY